MPDLPATPERTVARAREIGMEEGLRFVYTGNVRGGEGESTLCPGCGATVIGRTGFQVGKMDVANGKCRRCGAPIAGVWE
jgi:pyruvate formate lyase activating enzyme